MLEGHSQVVAGEKMLQNFLEGVRRGAEIQYVPGDLVHLVDVVLRQRAMLSVASA